MSAFSFADRISPGAPSIRVRAMLSFLSTEEGGRKTEAFSGYRPNHNFGEANWTRVLRGPNYFRGKRVNKARGVKGSRNRVPKWTGLNGCTAIRTALAHSRRT